MAIIIDGKHLSDYFQRHAKSIVSYLLIKGFAQPKLCIFTDGDDPASKVYVRNKLRMAEECGIKAEVVPLKSGSTAEEIIENNRQHVAATSEEYDGVIIQLPIKGLSGKDEQKLIDLIPPEKDVDGLTSYSVGKLHSAEGVYDGFFTPCTPTGILLMLDCFGISMRGKNAVVIGRSQLVGRPIAEMMLAHDATVTICHSKTKNLKEYTRNADILVSAAGVPGLITSDMVKPGAAVIDVGINRRDGKLCGDVVFDDVKEVAGCITPVPGGVGPMTVASLMMHTANAAKHNREISEGEKCPQQERRTARGLVGKMINLIKSLRKNSTGNVH